MKKLSLDDRLNNMEPKDTPLLWIGYTLLLIMLLVPMGCSHIEVLPGLCYTDKDGTFLCREPEPEDIMIDPIRDLEEDECEIWRNVDDPDAYMNCIMIA